MSKDLDRVVRAVVHPAIGFARVGSSTEPDGFYLAPEVPGAVPTDPATYRDADGRIKRQAQRFYVYGVDDSGKYVCELNDDNAEIAWAVHVANHKAAWYQFDQALDIPASQTPGADGKPLTSARRNDYLQGDERNALVIDGGARAISGPNTNPQGADPSYRFMGKFFSESVYLGELRTDDLGRLLFLGGRGKSSSPGGRALQSFGNNPGWHDDVSDGPVDAVVRIGDRVIQAEGAWVICAPPNYAPGITAFVTGWDLLFEVATKLNAGVAPEQPSFGEHILPVLQRLSDNQWVNAGLARDFGWGTRHDFRDPDFVARLGDPSEAARPLRQAIWRRFRDPSYGDMQTQAWPGVYGEAVELSDDTKDPREWWAILDIQYQWLERWADGDFRPDAPVPVPPWDDMDPGGQAYALDRAALEETTGGPFHPGTEFTWPMRHPSMYRAPFRIKRRTEPEPDWGDGLDWKTALAPGGPLDGSLPGSITRWMACPWQTDTSSCLSAYQQYSGDYLPTFWPARVPNDVLTEEQYAVVHDRSRAWKEREEAFVFSSRKKWLRGVVYHDSPQAPPPEYPGIQRITTFTEHWDEMGILLPKEGPGDGGFPSKLWVETGRSFGEAPAPKPQAGDHAVAKSALERRRKR